METLNSALLPLNEVILTSSSNVLTQQMVAEPNTIYVVKNVFNLNGQTIEVATNCTLDFRGGALINGNLKGNSTFIKALEYQIFDIGINTKLNLLGSFRNSSFSVHWFGAKGDGVTDDAPAINHALQNSCKVTIVLGNLNYLINSSIYLSINNLKLQCFGTISTNYNITMIDISSHYNNIDIHELKFNSPYDDDDYNFFHATAVLLSNNVYHCNVNINLIKFVKKGLAFIPVINLEKGNYAGSQYNKFTFQEIDAFYCIYINLLSSEDKGNNLWMNENQFLGGRVRGKYGVYVERPDYEDPKFDRINGNVFNCIGFEAIETPVYMYHSTMNFFNNVRMSESISSDIYIDLLDCNNITFDIKSFLPYSILKAEKCCQIQLSRLFSDSGLIMGYDRMAASNSSFPFMNGMQTSGIDNKYIYREESPLNILKRHYYDSINTPQNPINFNELFVNTWDNMMIFSNICEITVYNNVNINIDFNGSIYRLRPDLTIRYEHHGTSSIFFYNNYYPDIENEIPPIAIINKRGTYKVTTDRDYKIYIIPISIDAIQD